MQQSLASFRGSYDHTLDAKSRLSVPARYRAALGAGGVLAMPVDQRPCVGVWTPEGYERYTSARLEGLPALSEHRADLERYFYGNSQEVSLDAAGRIMIPGFLAEQAGLSRELTVVGAGERLELWDRDGWKAAQPALREGVSQLTKRADDAA